MLMSDKISSTKKPFVRDEIRLKRLESYREQYWSDEKYRLEKIEKIKQRSKTRVVCEKISLTAPCCHTVKFVEVSKNRAC